jgi:hypothetical protein
MLGKIANMENRPSFANFLRAFTVRWFVTMSGPLSVPLVVLAFWVESKTAKIGLGVTAIIWAIFASYWVWRVERQRAVELEAGLRDLMLSRAVLEVRLEQCEPYLKRHENRIIGALRYTIAGQLSPIMSTCVSP